MVGGRTLLSYHSTPHVRTVRWEGSIRHIVPSSLKRHIFSNGNDERPKNRLGFSALLRSSNAEVLSVEVLQSLAYGDVVIQYF